MHRVDGQSVSFHGLSTPAVSVLNATAKLALEGREFSVIEHKGPLTLSSDSFSTGGGAREHYAPHSLIPLSKGQSIQPKSGVVAGTTQRYAKIIGIMLAVGGGFAAIAALLAALWYSNRLLSGYDWGGYGFGGFGYW